MNKLKAILIVVGVIAASQDIITFDAVFIAISAFISCAILHIRDIKEVSNESNKEE